jgi:hypothetical protein
MRLSFVAALSLLAAASLQAQAVAPAPAVDYSVATPLPGTWAYAATGDGTEAVFRDTAQRPQLILHCLRASRQVSIARPASGAAPFLLVWTSSLSRQLPASFNPATGRISATLATYDPLLDALAFSRGRFAVGVVGSAALVVPAFPEVTRVIEDCRS